MSPIPDLHADLWSAVKSAYEAANYTSAILDGMHFLSDVLRERTGLQSDGVALVGEALGGKRPKLKLTPLRTETDLSIQKGMEQTLRGLYQLIRNPRSHNRIRDSKPTADALLGFLNYIISLLLAAVPPFTVSLFMKRVFDSGFVCNDRYATLLVKEIPQNQRVNVWLEVFRSRTQGDDEANVCCFLKCLFGKLQGKQKRDSLLTVEELLQSTTEDTDVRIILQLFPSPAWGRFNALSRLRAEGMLLRSIKAGCWDFGANSEGVLGTWLSHIAREFTDKEACLEIIATKLLSQRSEEEWYVFQYLFPSVGELADRPPAKLIRALRMGLTQGKIAYKQALASICTEDRAKAGDPWATPLMTHYSSFKQKTPSSPEDDVPF